jgi:hypothetical protein
MGAEVGGKFRSVKCSRGTDNDSSLYCTRGTLYTILRSCVACQIESKRSCTYSTHGKLGLRYRTAHQQSHHQSRSKKHFQKEFLVVQIKPQRTDTNVQKTQTPQINTPNHDIPVQSRIPRRKLQHTFYVNPRATTFLFLFNIGMVHVQTDPGTRAWPLKTDLRSPFDSPEDACRLDCFEMCVQRSRHASMECGSSAQPTHCLVPTGDQSREMHGGLVYWVLERVADVRGDGRRPIELGVRFGGCGWCGSNGPSRNGWK